MSDIIDPSKLTNVNAATIDKLIALSGNIGPESLETPHGTSDTFVVRPNGMTVESIQHLLPPQRIKQCVSLQDVESFAAYVNRFKDTNSLIFCNVDDGCFFNAMLDYHGPAKPRHCVHRAGYCADETPEWTTLQEKDRVSMTQTEFAVFLEENAKMFRDPVGADLLEIVKNLHGHKNARFQQSVRLDNGANSVSYEEDIVVKAQNATRSGSLELPGVLKVGLSVYVSGEQFEVTCRLKTRIEDRRVLIFYEIVGYAQIVRESTLALVKQVANATEIVPMLGTPN